MSAVTVHDVRSDLDELDLEPPDPSDLQPPIASPPRPRWVPPPPDDDNEPVALCDIEEERLQRESTSIPDLDRVLGGGLVPGTILILSGEPGSGKSTLTLQAADGLKVKTLYATGEETIRQAGHRARRIDVDSPRIFMVHENDLDRVLAKARRLRAELLVIDSIQTLTTTIVNGQPGSPSQVRRCTELLTAFAKETDTFVWLIGHVTNDGTLAGPKTLKHIVDVVLEIENANRTLRILRCDMKNRFGPSDQEARFVVKHDGINWIELEPEPEDDPEI